MPKTLRPNPPGLFRSILCPVDFSEHSAMALRYAAVLATRSAGRLHVLHVNDPILASAAAVAFADLNYAKAALAELRPFVAKAVPAKMMKTLSIRYAVETGDAARMIVSEAKRLGCDLIVMGTHGLSGLEKVLIGSTTERMLRRTSLPLLAIPRSPSEAIGVQEPLLLGPGTAILAPVDLREQSTRDVRDAEQIARALGTDLVLVHVVPPPQPPPWYKADVSPHAWAQVPKAQRRLESLARTVGPGVNTEVRVLTGRPADEIAAFAAEKRNSLVVMHLRRGPGLFGSRAGSIALHVLRSAGTPVLALPSRALGRLIGARASSLNRVRSLR